MKQFFKLYPPSPERPLGSWHSTSRDEANYYGEQPPDLSQILELSGGWETEHQTTEGPVFDITTQLAGEYTEGQFDPTYTESWQQGYNIPDPPSEDELPEGWIQEEDEWGQKKYIVDHYTNRWTPNGFFGSGQPPEVTTGTQDPGLGPVGGGPEPEGSSPVPAGSSPAVTGGTGNLDYVANEETGQTGREILKGLLATYGLDPKLLTFLDNEIIEGTSEIGIVQKLREQPEYKARFPGMAKRATAGFNAITESEYLTLEDEYRSAMVDAQISESFYDDADDFALLIGGDVSGEEFQRRVNLAYEAGTGADATVVQELEELYGVQKAQLTEIYLDPTKAKDILQKERQFRSAQMSAGVVGALGSGLSKSAAERLEKAALRTSDMSKLSGSRGLTSQLLNENALTTDQIALGSFGLDPEATNQIERTIENRVSKLGGKGGMYTDQGGVSGLRSVSN